MDIEEYAASGHSLYADFARAVSTLLLEAIATAKLKGTPPQSQHRAKAVDSLRARLAQQGTLGSTTIEADRKDLAGCRLIFYSNGDLAEFLNADILGKFDIDVDASKYHYPTDDAASQFRGRNIVVSLNEEQLANPDLSSFSGLRCEIQLQTILFHAWSETTHKLYKPPEWAAPATKAIKSIQGELDALMIRHLVPATYALEKAKRDFDSLVEAHPIFEKGPLKAIDEAADNNQPL